MNKRAKTQEKVRKHILILPSWYPLTPSDIGGSFFREQAIALKKAGYKVGVVSPYLISLKTGLSAFKNIGFTEEDDNGVHTFRFKSVNVSPRISSIIHLHWLKLGEWLFEQYIKKHGTPDIIHVHSMNKAAFLASLIFKKYKIPYVITEHSTAFARDLIKKDKLKVLFSLADSAQKRIAVSQAFANLLQEKSKGQQWQYIPNIVSSTFVVNEKEELKEPSNTFVFNNICLLTEKKKVDNLIEAFAKLSHDYKNIQLVIGGDGPLKPALEQQVKRLGLQEKIKFTGLLQRNEVIEQLRRCDAFVLSSEYETFGVVLVEALAQGKPVVATRCGGPESIVSDEVGVLVEKNDIEALYLGMKQVYQTQFDALKIKEYCIKNFSEKAVVEQLEAVYNQVLSKEY